MADNQRITQNLLEMYGRNDWIMRRNFRFFLDIAGITKMPRGTSILDCGCAMGHLILMLKREGFTSVDGFDASPEMVASARKLTGANVTLCDAVDMEDAIPANAYDLVIVSDLVHHLVSRLQWDRLLQGARHCLKPTGQLVIREPHPTPILRIMYGMSRFPVLHLGPLKARLRSFQEEDDLLRHFFAHWTSRYPTILAEHGFTIEIDRNWIVHRITVAKMEGKDS
jgi:2-polyprenyl-3-methyl-5-hydroxy-6-metoxy-1,4-benzoquinol methylase